jgi:hypothetical protein
MTSAMPRSWWRLVFTRSTGRYAGRVPRFWSPSTCIPGVAMQILRHSQIAMTMEVYSEVPTAKTRNALKRLGRRLGG